MVWRAPLRGPGMGWQFNLRVREAALNESAEPIAENMP